MARPTISPDVKERLDLLDAAKKDHAAVKAARKAGEPIPATPALDELTRRHAMSTTTKTQKAAGSGRLKGRTDVRYFHDGVSMPESHKHKLSTLAYFHSRNLDTASPARVGTSAFAQAIRDLGVEDPTQPGWMVKLPNGITVECRIDGEPSQYSGPAPTRQTSTKTAAKKATKATKKTAAKRTPATKTAAKKTPAKKTATAPRTGNLTRDKVTPLPKAKDARKSA